MNEEQQMYLEEVMENYKNPKNSGKLDNYSFKQHQKNTSCGDSFDLYVKIEDDKIKDISCDGEGCAISTASFSMLSEDIKGMTLEEVKALTKEDIFEMLGIKISPGKVNCALLSLKALQSGLEKFTTSRKN